VRAAGLLLGLVIVALGSVAQDAAGNAPPPEGEGQGETEGAAAPVERAPVEPRKANVDMSRFQEAFDEQIAEEQAEITQGTDATTRDGESLFLPALQSIVVLLVICGVILGLGYLAKRFGGRTPLLAGAGMGKPLGRLYLDPKVVLHFVETGGRVLVIGVTQGSIALITEFQADQFRDASTSVDASPGAPGGDAQDFLSALRRQEWEREASDAPEDLESLRGDLQRLKEFLRESQRDAGR